MTTALILSISVEEELDVCVTTGKGGEILIISERNIIHPPLALSLPATPISLSVFLSLSQSQPLKVS